MNNVTGQVYYNERVGCWYFSDNDNMEVEYEINCWESIDHDAPYGNIIATIYPTKGYADLCCMA